MKKFFLVSCFLIGSNFLLFSMACSKVQFSADGNSSTDTTTATTTVCSDSSCSGTTSTTTSVTTTSAIPSGFAGGFYAQTANFIIPGYINNGSFLNVGPGYAKVMREAMGVCERFSYGYNDCSVWLAGAHDFVLYSENGNNLRIILRSLPAHIVSKYDWDFYPPSSFREQMLSFLGFPSAYKSEIHDPLVLPVSIGMNNESRGFMVFALGPAGSPSAGNTFQLLTNAGRLDEGSWDFILSYKGEAVLTGHAVHCQSKFCGLDVGYFNGAF